MITSGITRTRIFSACVLAAVVFATRAPALAEKMPWASDASPEVYKIIAENEQFRVMEATWQPGQEDNFHAHTADRVSLFQTDCTLRLTKPDGSFRDAKPKAGRANPRTGKPVAAHKAKNIGDKVCIIRIIEIK